MPNASERHEKRVEKAVRLWADKVFHYAELAIPDEQIVGLPDVSGRELHRFFTQETNPGYWIRLAQSNPAEAAAQLQQWADLEKGSRKTTSSEPASSEPAMDPAGVQY